jgi:hypothetical protein
MDNTKKRSVSLGEDQYTSENMQNMIFQSKKQTDLLVYYLDCIRNYTELTEEMMDKIENFDDHSKMLIIKEFNKVIKIINGLFD